MLIYASCVCIQDKGVLIAGPSGIGKSDLALRLIDAGAQLIADDQTKLHLENDQIIATAPPNIKGLIEVRHIGLLRLPYADEAAIALYIDLTPINEPLERLPEPDTLNFLDHPIRRLRLPAFAVSTPAKIRASLLYPTVHAHL